MSVVGEQDGIAVELLNHLDGMCEAGEDLEEYWEGDPPSFLITLLIATTQDNVFIVVTSSGNHFKVTVEPDQK